MMTHSYKSPSPLGRIEIKVKITTLLISIVALNEHVYRSYQQSIRYPTQTGMCLSNVHRCKEGANTYMSDQCFSHCPNQANTYMSDQHSSNCPN